MIDPFALLQLPSTFTLSADALDMAWMRASATAHPDAGGSVNHAAQLNEARELLANPEQRANLRLNMLGGPNADQDQRLPDGFLMEMLELRERIEAEGKHTRIIAKIEKPEALEDLDGILEETDAVMIARGDLGVEIPKQEVPLVQKDIIQRCMHMGKPVIVATQMMESMIVASVPTRAEVNDVANAVLDGADAVMLSAETSVGAYPVEAVTAMTDIIESMEGQDRMYYHERPPLSPEDDRFISDSMCYNACRLAKRVNATAIVTMTFSGYTAVHVSSQRPKAHIFMFTANKRVLAQMSLVWGVSAFPYLKMVSTDHTIADIKFELTKMGAVTDGDFVVHLASMPIADAGRTNMLKLSQV